MAVVIALAGACAMVALAFERRSACGWAVALLALSAPLEVYRTDLLGGNLSVFRLALVAAAVVAVRSVLRTRTRPPLALAGAYLALTGVAALAVLANRPASTLANRQLAVYAIAAGSVAIIGILAREVGPARLAKWLVIGAIVPMLASSWQVLAPRMGGSAELPFVTGLEVAEGLESNTAAPAQVQDRTARTKGTFGDPNVYGVFLLLAGTSAIALAFDARRGRRHREALAYGLLGAAIVIFLVASYSRSAWLGAVIATAVLLAFKRQAVVSFARRNPRRLALAGVFALALAAPVAGDVIDRLDPGAPENSGSVALHSETADVAFHALLDQPLLGIGPGWLGPRTKQPPRTSIAHCTYLTIGAELGLTGLLVLLAAAYLALAALVARAREAGDGMVEAGLAAGTAGLLAANLTYDAWFVDVHWIVAGAAAATLGAGGARLRRTRPAAQ